MSALLSIYTDGGARGNPGPAACAYLIVQNQKLLHQDSKYLGITTNNQAEYEGVVLALNYLQTQKATLAPGTTLAFHLDSLLVVNQLSGTYKIKHLPLQRLAQHIHHQLESLGLPATFTYIPRAQNHLADALLNQELDQHTHPSS